MPQGERPLSVATIRDVAKRADVSIATVSRVINNATHRVNAATRDRVLAAIEELDYHPNAVAKSLSMRKTETVGVVIPDISNPYYAEIVRGIQDAADRLGYAVVLQNTDRSQQRMIRSVYLFREKLVDGIIFSGGVMTADRIHAALGDFRGHAVVIGRQQVDLPAVRVDNVGSAISVVEHLASLGRRRIAFIGGPRGSTTTEDRLIGYRKGLKRLGIQFERGLVVRTALSLENGYEAASLLLEAEDGTLNAIMAANDQMAIGAIKAAKDRHVSVPGDLAVVGFDNIPLSSYFEPSLTTVNIPRYRMGEVSMELLSDLIAGKETNKVEWLSCELIVRNSTRPG